MWHKVDEWRHELLQNERICHIKRYLMDNDEMEVDPCMKRKNVILQIENVVVNVLQDIEQKKSPSLTYCNRSKWQNVSFDKDTGIQLSIDSSTTSTRFDSIHSVNKLALTLKTLSLIYKLVQTDSYCTKRDLYYQDPNLFGTQSYLDGIINNISCMLKVPRWHLNILATSKGYVAGDLQFTEHDGNYVDCRGSTTGVLVPSHVKGMKNLYTSAKIVLVIEKDATFQKLLDDGILSKLFPCIMITDNLFQGKGVPDVNTRLLVKKLWKTFQIPTMALVDADPHGIEIMSIYKYGSLSMSFDAENLTLPTMKWLGVLPSDVTRLHVPGDVLLPLTQSDHDKARDLLKRPYIEHQQKWKEEIELILKMGYKAEIQCLMTISPTFLTDVYLPNKIKFAGWI